MKFTLILITLSLSALFSKGQENSKDSLFLLDSITVYVGIENTFKIDPNENIRLTKEISGLRVKINERFIQFSPSFLGAFSVELQTNSGPKKINVVSKYLPPPAKPKVKNSAIKKV